MTRRTALEGLLQAMEPVLQDGIWVFAVLPHGTDPAALAPVATMREEEGITVVIEEARALEHGLQVLFRAAWITLRVHSELTAVGLTAAFAGELARAGIGCNVVAGAFHDHIFVPVAQAQAALAALRSLQRRAQESGAKE